MRGISCMLVLHVVVSLCDGYHRTQNKLFRTYIVKARCQARCNEKYGLQSSSSEVFDVYQSYVCPKISTGCSECAVPCANSSHATLMTCLQLCTNALTPACNESCGVFYKIKQQESLHEEPTRSSMSLVLSKPEVTCHESYKSSKGKSDLHTVYLRWNVKDIKGNSTSSPIVFIVSMKVRTTNGTESPWGVLGKTNFSFVPIKELNPELQYRFNITAVSSSGTVDVSKTTEWIEMPKASFNISSPRDIHISKQVVHGSSVTAEVRWRPGYYGGCSFKIGWKAEGNFHDMFRTIEVKKRPELKYELTHLKFDTSYIVDVQTIVPELGRRSNHTTIVFRTLSCLNATNHNYLICSPDPILNIVSSMGDQYNVSDMMVVNVTIAWDLPAHVSAKNPVTNITLRWDKIPHLPLSEIIPAHHGSAVLNSNATRYELVGLHMNCEYWIDVMVKSEGGSTSTTRKLVLGSGYSFLETTNHDAFNTQNDTVSPDVRMLYMLAIIPVLLGVLAVITLILKRRQCHRRMIRDLLYIHKSGKELNPLYDVVDDSGNCKDKVPFLPKDEFEIDFSTIRFLSVLGEGAFGKVLKARINKRWMSDDNEQFVAVKLPKDNATPEERRSLVMEIEMMKQIGHHQNIVNMIGCCSTGASLCVIMDYCPLGDLRTYLRLYREKYLYQNGIDSQLNTNNKCPVTIARGERYPFKNNLPRKMSVLSDEVSDPISEATLLSYALQISAGMEFLSQRKFVHRDLAARNILVFSSRLLKISDFGLSRDVYETNMYQPTSARMLPYKWMPMESIFDNIFTTKSDVWSFGVVLWEIVTFGGCPYPGIPNKDLFGLLKEGYRMEQPGRCSHQIYDIMLSCWHPKPYDRPTFTDLRNTLDKMLETTQLYMDLTVSVGEKCYNSTSNETILPALNKTWIKIPNDTEQKVDSYSLNSDLENETTPTDPAPSVTDSSDSELDDYMVPFEQSNSVCVLAAPSLRHGMIGVLGELGNNRAHSRSLSEITNIQHNRVGDCHIANLPNFKKL